jgi:hypothetical protein
MFAVKRYKRGSTPAHAQGYFSATILVVVTFDGFTLPPCYRGTVAKPGLFSRASPALRGASRNRAADEG